VDLAVSLDRRGRRPLRDQLAEQLRASIRRGSLRPGCTLPASRPLATELGVSRGVVVGAYEELRHQGLIAGDARKSPRVTELAHAPVPDPPPARPYRFDLAPQVPDVGMFPRRQWLRALQSALDAVPDQALDYGDPRGQPSLRGALAEFLGRTRGVVCDPACIVICQGSIQAVDLACRTLSATGARTIALGTPCERSVHSAARFAGLQATEIELDPDGIDVDRLAALGPDAAVVSPVHQFPTGAAFSDVRRERLLAWARGTGATVIEDDYDAEFCYPDRAPVALQGAHPAGCIYVGSVSKALAPTIRLGWGVFPRRLAGVAGELKEALDGGSPAMEQIGLEWMISSAALERHLRHTRQEYARRRAAMIAAIERWMPEAQITGAGGGTSFAVHLTGPVARRRLLGLAEAARVRLRTLEDFRDLGPSSASTLIVGYGRVSAEAAPAAARQLAALVAAAGPGPVTRSRSGPPPRPTDRISSPRR
jgi:GntR family transcriptional regulator / MocR family aminotransferase